MNVKRKGSAGERELCEYLTAAGFPAHRNEQRYQGGYNNPDISAEGLEALHIECKRVEKLNVNEAMRQAAADAAGKTPVVMHRRNREQWLITLRLDDFLKGRVENGSIYRSASADSCGSSGNT